MGKRFDTLLFPGGKSKAFTLSYDDGVVQDRRLAALFRQYGLKCSFNLGSGLLGHKETGRAPGHSQGGQEDIFSHGVRSSHWEALC